MKFAIIFSCDTMLNTSYWLSNISLESLDKSAL